MFLLHTFNDPGVSGIFFGQTIIDLFQFLSVLFPFPHPGSQSGIFFTELQIFDAEFFNIFFHTAVFGSLHLFFFDQIFVDLFQNRGKLPLVLKFAP